MISKAKTLPITVRIALPAKYNVAKDLVIQKVFPNVDLNFAYAKCPLSKASYLARSFNLPTTAKDLIMNLSDSTVVSNLTLPLSGTTQGSIARINGTKENLQR